MFRQPPQDLQRERAAAGGLQAEGPVEEPAHMLAAFGVTELVDCDKPGVQEALAKLQGMQQQMAELAEEARVMAGLAQPFDKDAHMGEEDEDLQEIRKKFENKRQLEEEQK